MADIISIYISNNNRSTAMQIFQMKPSDSQDVYERYTAFIDCTVISVKQNNALLPTELFITR